MSRKNKKKSIKLNMDTLKNKPEKKTPIKTATENWNSRAVGRAQTNGYKYGGAYGGVQTYGGYKPKVVKVPELTIPDEQKEYYIKDMEGIFQIQAKSYSQEVMREFVLKVCESKGYGIEEDDAGNIYVTKGDALTYPCIVAHLDTVHSVIPAEYYKVKREGDMLYAIDSRDCSRIGVGGDDQVGIWLALTMLEELQDCKAAFFCDEEVGCVGSREADMSWFVDVSIALQGDRKGYGDFVDNISGTQLFGSAFSKAIEHILEKYEYSETSGGLTDVMQLADNGLECAVANASCGYYDPHTKDEYVKCNESILTFLMFKEIIEENHVDGYRWDEKRDVRSYYGTTRSGNSCDKGYDNADGYEDVTKTRWDAQKQVWYNPNVPEETEIDDIDRKLLESAKLDREEKQLESFNRLGPVGTECSFCHGQTTYDDTVDLDYCWTCQDYDYNAIR